MSHARYPTRAFCEALGLNFVWMNISELLRWFLVIKAMVRADFAMVPGIAPGTPIIGALWTVWDLLLIAVTSVICWIVFERSGPGWRTALAAGTLVWLAVFVILWLGAYNMGLATARIVFTALPLAWLELLVAALIISWRIAANTRGARAR